MKQTVQKILTQDLSSIGFHLWQWKKKLTYKGKQHAKNKIKNKNKTGQVLKIIIGKKEWQLAYDAPRIKQRIWTDRPPASSRFLYFQASFSLFSPVLTYLLLKHGHEVFNDPVSYSLSISYSYQQFQAPFTPIWTVPFHPHMPEQGS